jgi:hypothetical protein
MSAASNVSDIPWMIIVEVKILSQEMPSPSRVFEDTRMSMLAGSVTANMPMHMPRITFQAKALAVITR